MDFPTQLFGIIGHPLGHSMSPALHNWGFRQAGFPGLYMLWPTPPEGLADFFSAVRALDIRGGNITIPHKVESMRFVDEVSDAARRIGAINTFFRRDGRLCGENTDVTGFMAPLRDGRFRRALVLGAGGASRAVLAGLRELGVPEILLTNRTPGRAEEPAERFDAEVVPWEARMEPEADLIVNTTSEGMRGGRMDATPYGASALSGRTGLVYDIVYNPLETRLLREARAAGWKTVGGLTMFVEQARAAFRLWTDGLDMPAVAAEERVRGLLGL